MGASGGTIAAMLADLAAGGGDEWSPSGSACRRLRTPLASATFPVGAAGVDELSVAVTTIGAAGFWQPHGRVSRHLLECIICTTRPRTGLCFAKVRWPRPPLRARSATAWWRPHQSLPTASSGLGKTRNTMCVWAWGGAEDCLGPLGRRSPPPVRLWAPKLLRPAYGSLVPALIWPCSRGQYQRLCQHP